MDTAIAASNREQSLAVFQHASAEIRFFKTQQWLVTSYALTAFFALAVAPEWMAHCREVESKFCAGVNFGCALVVLVITIFALWVLGSLDESHHKELKRMDAARGKLQVILRMHGVRFRPAWWFRWMQSVVRHIRRWFWGLPVLRHIRRWKLSTVRRIRRRFGPVNSGRLALLHLGERRSGETVTILRFALSIGAVLAIVINVLRGLAGPTAC